MPSSFSVACCIRIDARFIIPGRFGTVSGLVLTTRAASGPARRGCVRVVSGRGGSFGSARFGSGSNPLGERWARLGSAGGGGFPPEYSAEALRPSNTESSDSSGFRTDWSRSRLLLRRRRLPPSLPPSLLPPPPPPPRLTSPCVLALRAASLAAWRLLASAFRSASVS